MAIKKSNVEAVVEPAVETEAGTETTVETQPETPNGSGKKRGPKKGVKRGPMGPRFNWTDERTAALVETLYDLQGTGVALTVPAIVQALSQHEAVGSDGYLLKETSVKAELDRVRESLGEEDAALLPELESNRKRVVNTDALRAIIAARRSVANA